MLRSLFILDYVLRKQLSLTLLLPDVISLADTSILAGFILARVVLALDLEGVHDLKLHHPSSSVATSNQ